MTSQDHAQNSAWSSSLLWEQQGGMGSTGSLLEPRALQGEWGVHAVTVALQSHTWTQALGDGENRMKLPDPLLVEEKVRGHKELGG